MLFSIVRKHDPTIGFLVHWILKIVWSQIGGFVLVKIVWNMSFMNWFCQENLTQWP